MKKRLLYFLTFACSIFVFTSCRQTTNQLALFVPKDATAVLTINAKTITDKIASSGLTIDSLANLFTNQKDEEPALHWSDIKNSGIDLTKSFYIFFKQVNSMQQGYIRSGALVAEIEDAKKLEAFFQKEKAVANVVPGGKYKYMALGNGCVAGWSDKVLIISFVTNGNNSLTAEDTLSQLQLATLFTQKKSASIASVDEFMNGLSKPGDIHFYTNAAANLNAVAMPGMSKINSLMEGSYTEGDINFEKGKMIAASETHYNKTLSDIINKYPSKEIDADMIKSYPDTLTGFSIISFNPKVLIDILHYLGFDMMADGFASNLGFTTNDVINAFSGDIAVMLSLRPKDDTSLRNPGFLLNLAIGDKASFDKVLNGLLNKQILTKQGDEYQLGSAGGHNFVIETGSNNLFISSSGELVKSYQTSDKKTALPSDIEKQISNKSMALYVDINNLLKNKSVKDSSADIHLQDAYNIFNVSQAARETFKNVIATTGKSDGKTIKGNFELNFVNTDENSLASLVKFMAVARTEKLKRKDNTPTVFFDGIHKQKDNNAD